MSTLRPITKDMDVRKYTILAVFSICLSLIGRAQSPGGVSSGLSVWLKADAGTSSTVDNAYLNSWNDQSGNGNNATQSVANAKPQFLSNQINGNPIVKTTGPRYFNLDLSDIDNSNYTIFTVTKRQSGNNFQHIIGVQQPGSYVGLCLGYSGTSLIRFFQYGNLISMATTAYAGANETPAMLSSQFDMAVGKKVWHIREGVLNSRSNNKKTHYSMTGQGNVGRGNDAYGFNGQIAEVIVYNRVLTDAEKRQIHTYLSVKYGLAVPVAEHIYYNEPSYANDIFGIGKNLTTEGLNQVASTSLNPDDILEIRNPSSLDNGDYMICGNNDGAKTFSVHGGGNCAISTIMDRRWKFRNTGTPGTVSLRFDMTGIAGFSGDKLILLVDTDGDGFDDETPMTGTYVAPYFEVNNVNIVDGSIVTIATGDNIWYAVATGNTSGAIWSNTPAGAPQILTSFCTGSSLVVNTGVTVTNDWPTMSCKDFTINLGGIWNASNGTMNVGGNITTNGTYNAQSGTIVMNGTAAQTIGGLSITNVYNLTASNAAGVVIDGSSNGVRARNLVSITTGTLTTNSRLTLISDIASTGMITSLASGSVSGNVTIQRYHNASAQGWVNLSCPVQGKTIQDWNDDLVLTGFLGSDFPPPYAFNNVQTYDESVSGGINVGYIGATNVSNTLDMAKGYFVFMNAGVMNMDVDGSIYSGDISVPVTYTNTGNPGGDGWNMVGNPYPCTIDWNSASWTKTNINNAVYVWNAAIGQYASYVNGFATNGGSRYIAPSQSFFVVTNNSSPTLTLRENCKSNIQGTFKSTDVMNASFTLRIENDLYSDETTVVRNDDATLQFDQEFDAFKLRSPLTEVPYLATISDGGDDLSVNSFKTFTQSTIIPLRVEVGATGTYIISHKGLSSFANGSCVVLEDMLTGSVYPLNQYDDISFELEAGQDDLRFQLRISGAAVTGTSTSGCPGVENGSIAVEVPGTNPVNITWMNGEGEVILTSIGVTGTDEISGLAPGTYFVSLDQQGVCGSTLVEILIMEDPALFTNAIVTPVSCLNEDDGGIALNIMGGTAPFAVTWSNGYSGQTLEDVETGEYVAFVTDSKGCNSQFIFNVPVNSTLVSEFETLHNEYELMNGAVQVDFYNTSEDAVEYLWTFGDATLSSSEANPTHMFNTKGIYDVTLRVTNDDCEAFFTKSIKISNPKDDGSGMSSEMIGTLTDNGVQIMFFFDQPRSLRINAYNVLGQQLIEQISGVYERQTITFSDRRYAANALIEVIDINTGERALLRMGI